MDFFFKKNFFSLLKVLHFNIKYIRLNNNTYIYILEFFKISQKIKKYIKF